MSNKTYRINEIFYSLQGEGIRAGTANVFVRFSGCNLKCNVRDEFAGFDCDTEFTSGTEMTADEIARAVVEYRRAALVDTKRYFEHLNVIFTGGEPALQIDQPLVDLFKAQKWFLAIETNGTKELPNGIDWITVSPKSAEHTIVVRKCNELKYVRNSSQALPRTSIVADNYLISPAFEAGGWLKAETLTHCIEMCKAAPKWRLSVQQHKIWQVR